MADRKIAGGPMTLGAILKDGGRIVAFCNGCGHQGQLDLPALIQKHGANFRPGADLKRFCAALHCVKCGWRGGRVEFHQGRGAESWGGAHRGHDG